MQKFPSNWTYLQKINFLQRKIIVSSILYYNMHGSPISDKEYDELSVQLVDLQREYGVLNSQYEYVFYDFDGSTGFDLFGRLSEKDKNYLTKIALMANNMKVGTRKSKVAINAEKVSVPCIKKKAGMLF